MTPIPVIDLFAGPGGLGEGFSRVEAPVRYDLRLSCEVDSVACRTLRFRKFFHLAKTPEARADYLSYVTGELPLAQLISHHRAAWREAARRTAKLELGNPRTRLHLHRRIARALGGDKDRFVLIGGPPCQAYSLVGRSRRLGVGARNGKPYSNHHRRKLAAEFYDDPKHRLYREYLEILAVHRPLVFVMENVKGLTSARVSAESDSERIFNHIVNDLTEPANAIAHETSAALSAEFGPLKSTRYRLISLTDSPTNLFGNEAPSDFIVKSEQFGVPQARHRLIIVGIREDIEGTVPSLDPQPPVPAKDVLRDLPALRSGLSRQEDSAEAWIKAIQNEYESKLNGRVEQQLELPRLIRQIRNTGRSMPRRADRVRKFDRHTGDSELLRWLLDAPLKFPLQHETRSHMQSDLARYLFCSAFARAHDRSPLLEEWPTGGLRPQHRNIQTRGKKLVALGFSDRFKVQGVGNKPASTITSHIAKDGHYYIHFDPIQCRSLTVREAARLQTFPDSYYFLGNRTQQYHQVGNAVPPFLAFQIGKAIGELLKSALHKFSKAAA